MGLLTDLLLLPVMGPLKGMAFIAQQVQDAAEEGLVDEEEVQAELLSLSMQRDAGQISEEEYEAYETELLDLLEAMRIYRESMMDPEAMAVGAGSDEE
jgi:PHD/YefM family antitoxin component YafN of YafNO toxin-antitoxin module